MEKFIVDKPIAYRNGNNQILARILPIHSDLSSIDRSDNPRYQLGHTLMAWGEFSDMSDEDIEKAPTIQEQIQKLLRDTITTFPYWMREEVEAELANGNAENIFNVLSENPTISIFLLAFSKDNVRKVNCVSDANALCFAIYEGDDSDFAEYWKESTNEQFENALYLFSLYMRKCVYDFIIETWEGSDDPEAHLEDGEGFDEDHYMNLAHQFVDLDDSQDISYIWNSIDEFVAAMLSN